jgi:inorganic triphosphatase YgiF
MSTETELKLSCPPDALAVALKHPLVAAAPAQDAHQHLVATYYDSDDFALRRHHIALRVRNDGGEWLQTVKSSNDSSPSPGILQHEETTESIEGRTLDLTKLPVRGQLGEFFADSALRQALREVVTTDIRRETRLLKTGQGELIEIAMDRGEVRAGGKVEPITEIELELVKGEDRALYKVALSLAEQIPLRVQSASKVDLGYALLNPELAEPMFSSLPSLSREMSSEDTFVTIMERCLEHFHGNETPVIQGHVEGVHQMRVGLRRLRSCLTVFRPLISREAALFVRDETRWLNDALGPVRDWDVFQEGVEVIAAHIPGRRGLLQFIDKAKRIRQQHHEEVAKRLQSPRYTLLVLRLGDWLSGRRWRKEVGDTALAALQEPIEPFARSVLRKVYKRMIAEGQGFGQLPAETKHDLRIRCKRLRYALQFFTDLYGKDACKPMLRSLGVVQDDLGLLNDLVVAERLLDEARLARTGATRALIDGWYAARLAVQEDHAVAAWDSFAATPRPWKT